MAFCRQCGTQLEDQAIFCPGCGAKRASTAPANQEKAQPKKKPKVGMIIGLSSASVVLVALIVGGIWGLKWYFSPEQKLLRALDSGDIATAVQIVDEDKSLRKNEKLEEALKERMDALRTEFASGEKEYSAVVLELDNIEQMKMKDLEGMLSDTRDYVERINQSKTCFYTGETFFAEGKYVEAMEQYAQVIEDDCNYEAAKTKHSESVSKYRENILAEAAEFASAAQYTNAIKVLNAALSNIPGDGVLTEKIAIYKKDLQESEKSGALDNASAFASRGEYTAAIEVLNQYISKYGDDVTITLAYDEYVACYIDQKILAASQKANAGSYIEALNELEDVRKTWPSNSKITAAYNEYSAKYVDSIKNTVDSLIAKKDFTSASKAINDALRVLPNNASLKTLMSEVEAKAPVSIAELIPINATNNWNRNTDKELVDALGFTYYDAINAFAPWQDGYGEYYIKGMYTTVSGELTSYYHMTEERECHLQIYADDKLIYTSPEITQKTEAFSFEVNIPEGTKFIKFVNIANGYSCSNILIINLLLWP